MAESGYTNLTQITGDDPRYDPRNDAEHEVAVADMGDIEASHLDRQQSVQETVRRAIEEAVQHFQEELEPDMARATDYYYGREFGNERERRSSYVSTDVRDITLSQVPSLVRILWGPDNVVAFRAARPDKEAEADQATESVRHIITEDNPGFLSTVATLKDGLVRRLGWWKWWADDEERTERLEYTGLTQEQAYMLSQDESIDNIEILGQFEALVEVAPGEQTLVPVYNIAITRRVKTKRIYAREVPPEEIAFTPNARSEEEAPCFVHSRYVPADYLYSRGYDPELIEKCVGQYSKIEMNGLDTARQVHEGGSSTTDSRSVDALDVSQRPVLFTEAYVLIAVDPEYAGRAERRRFDCIGADYEVANGDGLGECVSEVPFAAFTPEPEPHTLVGMSNWDLGKDLQLMKSQVIRHTNDSLAETVNPVTVVVTGEVNMGDLLKPDASRIVRVRKDVNNSIREVRSTFVGDATLPVLAYFDEVLEKRFGVDHGASGLDADALQSTEKQAAASVLSAKQQRIEMIARVYAETTMKRLFRGVLRLFVRHQDRARWMRLRGKWVEIDPRSWDATMDVTINVGLGQGTPQDRIGALSAITGNTKELLAAGSPLVSNVELRRVLARGYQMAGFNPDEFLKPWGQQEEAQFQEMLAQQPHQPTPEEQLVEIERQKAMASAAIDAEKLDLEKLKLELQDDRERDKMAQDAVLKEREIETKFRVDLKDLEIRKQVAERRNDSAGTAA